MAPRRDVASGFLGPDSLAYSRSFTRGAAEVIPVGDPRVEALFDMSRPAAVRNMRASFRQGPLEMEPEKWSDQADFISFKKLAAHELSRTFERNVTADGRVYGNGIRSNFYALNYVSGYPMIPATYPLYDNAIAREKVGLVNSMQEQWHENALRALTRLCFTDLELTDLKLRPSSSMMRKYTRDTGERSQLALSAIAKSLEAGALLLQGKVAECFAQTEIGGANHTVSRMQASDGVTRNPATGKLEFKERLVYDLAFAASGGKTGRVFPADRRMEAYVTEKDRAFPKGVARQRQRIAKGVTLMLNAPLMMVAQPTRANMYRSFPRTYHFRTPHEEEQRLRQWGTAIVVDVASHDILWWNEVGEVVAAELGDMGYDPRWLALFKLQMRMPDYVTGVSPDADPVLIGDWREPTSNGGLSSGGAFTDILGSIGMTWVYLIAMVEHTYPALKAAFQDPKRALETTRAFLEHRLPIGLVDKSDDAIMLFSSAVPSSAIDKLRRLLAEKGKVSPYMNISYEDGGMFCGKIVYYPREDATLAEARLIGDVSRAGVNKWCNEYSIQSALKDRSKARRPYPGLGWPSLRENYSTAPAYNEVMSIFAWAYKKTWHVDMYAYQEAWFRESEAQMLRDRRFGFTDLVRSPADAEVLADPSKLGWRYLPEDVNPLLVDMLFTGVPKEEFRAVFNAVVPAAHRVSQIATAR